MQTFALVAACFGSVVCAGFILAPLPFAARVLFAVATVAYILFYRNLHF